MHPIVNSTAVSLSISTRLSMPALNGSLLGLCEIPRPYRHHNDCTNPASYGLSTLAPSQPLYLAIVWATRLPNLGGCQVAL